MIRPIYSDPFMDDEKVLAALRQARASAITRAAATNLPLIDWQDGLLLTTDAVITEIKDGKASDDHGHGGLDD